MAFWHDLGNARDYTCVVVMSEFGCRLRSNTSGGTDHGYGNAMVVLGGTVADGQMLGEVMTKHMGAPDLGRIFPAFEVQARGVIL